MKLAGTTFLLTLLITFTGQVSAMAEGILEPGLKPGELSFFQLSRKVTLVDRDACIEPGFSRQCNETTKIFGIDDTESYSGDRDDEPG